MFKFLANNEKVIEPHKVIYGWELKLVMIKLRWTILKLAISTYKSPVKGFKALLQLMKLRRSVKGKQGLNKMVKANGKYYLGVYVPGWNGVAFKSFILSELNKFKKVNEKVNRFNTVFLAITKKCILQCEHCFEWDALNKKDVLTEAKLQKIITKLILKGVNQVYLTGGEPMLKLNTIINLIKSYKNEMDFWVLTSGYNLNLENALTLKKVGLKGVVISLDHYMPSKHNNFRGNENSYDWVEEAVKNAQKANLIVALSICITKAFAVKFNVYSYMKLAKIWGVSFVQFLEPKDVGHYKGKDVTLLREHEVLLEEIFLEMNNKRKYRDYPLIVYHGYHQRRIGCFNGGMSGLYIDTDGIINSCPFCHSKTASILDDDFDDGIMKLENKGCAKYDAIEY